MFKVMVDATPISPKLSGVGFYVASLIEALYNLQDEENFQLAICYQPGFKNWLKLKWDLPYNLKQYSNSYRLPLPVRISNSLLERYPAFFAKFAEPYLKFPDIFQGTNYVTFPYKKSFNALNIYDLAFIKYPEYINSVVEKYANRVKKCLNWTDLVITISESSKKDIIKYLNVDPSRIYVTPLASRYSTQDRIIYTNLPPSQDDTNYNLNLPYLLFVSTIEPRKNINSLITAFEYLKDKHKIPHDLILIGQKGWRYEKIFSAIANSPWNKNIHHLNYLPDPVVAQFYVHADVFVYPSYYEGFGLPVLEAMTLGAPVVTSNTSSLPEVAGDAAVLINPNEPLELAEAILKVISDTQFRNELIKKGNEQAKLFSWEKTARETLKAYRAIL